ncbi:alpha/beta hydrolase [Sphingomonas asaccharolytica]|uniref:alpha/beta hydrolase n=1 Tax=Sphingomonas asaccharolytica TaxID=40681 RepID=UPI000835E6DA|nr:alpha/beta hydrolase [Sphingomonas asaccharolytica]
MATFVLVHGAWHGSWCWARVRQGLLDQGHRVFTPTLTGVAELSHALSPDIDLQRHVDDVTNLIRWEELDSVILCGHSYGGCVISGVADMVPERIAALIYLDAFLLEDGECLHDLLPAEHRELQVSLANDHGEGWRVPPIPAEIFNVNAVDRDWVDRQCTPQPLATFQQPLRLRGGSSQVARNHFIYASDWEGTPFTACYDRAKARGWTTGVIACGHDVMLDRPEALTAELIGVATVPA